MFIIIIILGSGINPVSDLGPKPVTMHQDMNNSEGNSLRRTKSLAYNSKVYGAIIQLAMKVQTCNKKSYFI